MLEEYQIIGKSEVRILIVSVGDVMPYVRFFRRFPLIPGLLYLNISKSGLSISVGKRGWTVTFGKHGVRFTVGLPGTGLFITENKNYKSLKHQNNINNDIQTFIGVQNGKKKTE